MRRSETRRTVSDSPHIEHKAFNISLWRFSQEWPERNHAQNDKSSGLVHRLDIMAAAE